MRTIISYTGKRISFGDPLAFYSVEHKVWETSCVFGVKYVKIDEKNPALFCIVRKNHYIRPMKARERRSLVKLARLSNVSIYNIIRCTYDSWILRLSEP